nr:hypothetical protein [Tanacetum cinerariifolium]
MEESKKCSWFSKGQKLETVRVPWSAYHTIYNHSDDLASREKISIEKVHSGTNAQQCKYQVYGRIVGLYNVLILYMLILSSFRVDAAEDFKENMLKDYNCWYELKLLNDVDDTKLRLLEQSAAVGIKTRKYD